jgi:hypothetical protein
VLGRRALLFCAGNPRHGTDKTKPGLRFRLSVHLRLAHFLLCDLFWEETALSPSLKPEFGPSPITLTTLLKVLFLCLALWTIQIHFGRSLPPHPLSHQAPCLYTQQLDPGPMLKRHSRVILPAYC